MLTSLFSWFSTAGILKNWWRNSNQRSKLTVDLRLADCFLPLGKWSHEDDSGLCGQPASAGPGCGAAARGESAGLDIIIVCTLCGPQSGSLWPPAGVSLLRHFLAALGWVGGWVGGGAGGLVVWATAGSQAFQSPRKAW
jgi:hypothetical protein